MISHYFGAEHFFFAKNENQEQVKSRRGPTKKSKPRVNFDNQFRLVLMTNAIVFFN